MLAPTIQFSNNNQNTKKTPTPHTCGVFPQTPNSGPFYQSQCVPQSIERHNTRTLASLAVHTPNQPKTSQGAMLLRKEVIQPHLPVRLPCYDFVPIASPTFDHSPHKGWAMGFGCYRLS